MNEPHPSESYVPEVWPGDVLEVQPAPKKGVAWLAWVLILSAVSFVLVLPHVRPIVQEAAQGEGLQVFMITFQARYVLGMMQLFGSAADRDQLYRQFAESLNNGTVRQRLRFVIFAGEIKDPDTSLEQLAHLEAEMAARRHQATEEERKLIDLLERLYEDYDRDRWTGPALGGAEREYLIKELGWFGKLALAPEKGPDKAARAAVLDPARRTFLTVLIGFLVVGAVGLLGLIGLIVIIIMAASGSLRAGIRCGSNHGGVYAETFALWMIVFLIFTTVAPAFAKKEVMLLTLGLAILATLVVLIWPVLRGIPWRTVREDVGLTWGRQPVLEPVLGIATYAMALPMLAVGVIGVLILMALTAAIQAVLQGGMPPEDPFSPVGVPGHPIVEFIVKAGWFGKFQVLFVASFVAPIVEEIMFRGFLHRHLREATCKWGSGLSICFSAFVVSFIFAVIHPQGFVAVPALMALAIGFTLAREWRGTLIPSMVAHGVNNGIITTLVMAIMSE